jgi:hypothetical protein
MAEDICLENTLCHIEPIKNPGVIPQRKKLDISPRKDNKEK